MKTFEETKHEFKTAFRQITRARDDETIDEAAFPAYAHANPLIDLIFWQRLRIAFEFAQQQQPQTILDFGCGSGVMSYLLATKGFATVATDLDLGPLRLLQQSITFPTTIEFIEGDILDGSMANRSFDLILALDVLEHVDDLPAYVALFDALLQPNGVVIVSGPTENIFYKIGRKLAGKRFSGEYHVSNIASIRQDFAATFDVETLRRLIFPLTLFEVFAARKR